MKEYKVLAFTLTITLLLSSCCKDFKDDEQVVGFDNAYLAFPGINGELQTYIVNGDTIVVEKINGIYVFQGDMVLTENQLNFGSSKGAGLTEWITRWSNNTVYYTINKSFLDSSIIYDAFINYQEETFLRFVRRTNQPNYIEFIENTNPEVGGYSNVGMIGGRQVIAITSSSRAGVVVHEIGHAIGLIHEHSRSDRDQFIKINFDNIIPKYKTVFSKLSEVYKTSSFDFSSIMMYPFHAFGINGSTTITKIDGSTYTIQLEGLAPGDIEIVNLMYPYLAPVGDIIFNPNLTYGSVQDIDGNTYKTIQIGSQTWMAENLKTTKYRDGSDIPNVTNATGWNNLISPGYCWYGYDANFINTYGALYNWYAINTDRICPNGWHIPDYTEWETLFSILMDPNTDAGKLKETGTIHWDPPNSEGTNESGFTALPGGECDPDGTFYELGITGFWWTGTAYDLDYAYAPYIDYDEVIFPPIFHKKFGFSVRCIKD